MQNHEKSATDVLLSRRAKRNWNEIWWPNEKTKVPNAEIPILLKKKYKLLI